MGGHGGLNILPQKKWNVYRQDRQYQVKFDEHRDIEGKLQAKDKLKKEKLKDSLVLLRRKAQGVENIDDVGFHTERELKRKRSRSAEEPVDTLDEELGIKRILEFDKKVDDGHINLFAKEEREFEEHNRKKRESLIKSGCYIYNAKSKGPRNVNVYVDDENAKLVPDFNKVTTPWYMLPRNDNNKASPAGSSSSLKSSEITRGGRVNVTDVAGTISLHAGEAKESSLQEEASLTYLSNSSKKSVDELRNDRLLRESLERERALALLRSQ